MMGRSPSSDESGLKKGPWTPEEDKKLVDYIRKNGHGCWRALPKNAGINRCGKSCRLRWTNYLRPDIKRGKFSKEEEEVIINVHSVLGNKWSAIASHLPGRTDNEIKNYWNTHLRKKLFQMGIDPITHRPRTDLNNNNLLAGLPQLLAVANLANLFNQLDNNNALSLHYPSNHATLQLLATNEVNNLLQLLHTAQNPSQNLFGTTAFQDQRTYMDLQSMKSQLDQGLNDGQFSFSTLNNVSPFDLPNLEEHPQQKPDAYRYSSSMAGASRDFGCNMNSNYQIPCTPFSVPRAENPMPSLESSSPKHNGGDNNFNKPEEIIGSSNPPSASTTCEAWAEFMDDGSSDSFWKDMEQASSSHGPF